MADGRDQEHERIIAYLRREGVLTVDALRESTRYSDLLDRSGLNGVGTQRKLELDEVTHSLYENNPEVAEASIASINQELDDLIAYAQSRKVFADQRRPRIWTSLEDRFVLPNGIAYFKELLPSRSQREHLAHAYAAKPGEPVIASAPLHLGGLLLALEAVNDPNLRPRDKLVAEEMLEHYSGLHAQYAMPTATRAIYAANSTSAVIRDYPGAPADFALRTPDRSMPLGPHTWIAPRGAGRTVAPDAKEALSGLTLIEDLPRFNNLTRRLRNRDARVWRLANPENTERAVWVDGIGIGGFGVNAYGGVGPGPALGVARERQRP